MSSRKHKVLVVGAGLTGSVIARELSDRGIKVDVIDYRSHIGGNCYTKNIEDNIVHTYGPHIFHTNDTEIIKYVTKFSEWTEFINQPIADYNGERYNLPFNMNTFYQVYGVKTLGELNRVLDCDKVENPKTFEDHAVNSVGRKMYEKLIKEYTEKQWGRPVSEVPTDIIKRIPVRKYYDNNYFNDKFQAIPTNGYTEFIQNILDNPNITVTIWCKYYHELLNEYDHVFFTGKIDEYFNYSLGELEYRGLNFVTTIVDKEHSQCNAVINYTSKDVDYTRIVEHNQFIGKETEKIVQTYELPSSEGSYYPINDDKNNSLYEEYQKLPHENVTFCGRLGSYRYMNMDQCIREALDISKSYYKDLLSL